MIFALYLIHTYIATKSFFTSQDLIIEPRRNPVVKARRAKGRTSTETASSSLRLVFLGSMAVKSDNLASFCWTSDYLLLVFAFLKSF